MTEPTSTERLRAMLDERGVEHYDGTEMTLWLKEDRGYRAIADEVLNGFIRLQLWCTSPEQAIAATLGAGTCQLTDNGPWGYPYVCSECGASFDVDVCNGEFNFCPNCGCKVVDE